MEIVDGSIAICRGIDQGGMGARGPVRTFHRRGQDENTLASGAGILALLSASCWADRNVCPTVVRDADYSIFHASIPLGEETISTGRPSISRVASPCSTVP
jgi:hypothetical protein